MTNKDLLRKQLDEMSEEDAVKALEALDIPRAEENFGVILEMCTRIRNYLTLKFNGFNRSFVIDAAMKTLEIVAETITDNMTEHDSAPTAKKVQLIMGSANLELKKLLDEWTSEQGQQSYVETPRSYIVPHLAGDLPAEILNCINRNIENIAQAMAENGSASVGMMSDGYHTFDELYDHRAKLFATLCNSNRDKAFKSLQHHDPDFPMYDGMFICGLQTQVGWATYHYNIDQYWDMFKVPEWETAPEFDGHTPEIAANRILLFGDKLYAVNSALKSDLKHIAGHLRKQADDLSTLMD